jgi:hypothetical protein
MTRSTHWTLAAVLLAGCSGSVSEFVGDGADDPARDTAADTAWDVPADVVEDTPGDGPGDVADEDGPPEHGECRTSADCDGRPCIRVPDRPGGHWLCKSAPHDEATECISPYPEMDECCTSAECTDGMRGGCFYTDDITVYCGGPEPIDHNVCIYDECMTAGDCVAEGRGTICLPADLFGWPRRRCVSGTCRVDADCTAAAGGDCAPITDYCCRNHLQGFFCVYPGACSAHEDCPGGEACVGDFETGGTYCDFYACPL